MTRKRKLLRLLLLIPLTIFTISFVINVLLAAVFVLYFFSINNFGDLVALPGTNVFHSHEKKTTLWYGNKFSSFIRSPARELPDSDSSDYILIDPYNWIYSNGNIYNNKEKVFTGIKGPIVLRDGYLIAKTHVFWAEEDVVQLAGVNVSAFKKYSDDGMYYSDGTHLIYQDRVASIDFSTLQLYSRGTFKDSSVVYIYGTQVDGANPKTFQPVFAPYYYKDDSNVYYAPKARAIPGADPETFMVFAEEPRYTKDSVSVYYSSTLGSNSSPIILEGADADTFQFAPNRGVDTDPPHHAFDAYRYYLWGRVVGER